MRIFFVLLALASALAAEPKRLDLGFPQLKERVQVIFPENYVESRSWPAIFYYHGTGGSPTTELIRAHTGDQDWFVIGMTYEKEGNLLASPEAIDRERKFLDSARDHLVKTYRVDPRRTYVAGFSKGGWMSGFLLQRDPKIAGAIILGAGHNFEIQRPRKFHTEKPLFVGIGRLDANYPFALRALVHYRPLGAETTFETWHDLGHRIPADGSQSLKQWLAMEASPDTAWQPRAEAWLADRFDEIRTLPDLVDQWIALRDLEGTPFFRVAGDSWKSKITDRISELEQGDRVAAESKALDAIRDVLRKEVSGKPGENLAAFADAYLKLSEEHAGTRQAKIAAADHERIKRLTKHFEEQAKIAKEKEADDPFSPGEAGDENNDPFPQPPKRIPLIPRNPLIR